MKTIYRRLLLIALCVGLLGLLHTASLIADTTISTSQTWDGGDGSSRNWSAANNWITNSAPPNDGTSNIIFEFSTSTSPIVDINYNIRSLAFSNTSNQYSLTGRSLTIQSGGITNNSTVEQIIWNPLILGDNQTWNAVNGNIFSSGDITGTYSLTKIGSKTLTVYGFDTYRGEATISEGILEVNSDAIGSSINIANNGTLVANCFIARVYSSSLNGTGNFIKTGDSSLTLQGFSSFTGTTTISAGALRMGIGMTFGDAAVMGNIINNSKLEFVNYGNVTIPGVISGTGSLLKRYYGTLFLTGNNNYTGSTEISEGSIQLGDGNINGSMTGVVRNNGSLIINSSSNQLLNLNVTGSGSLTKTGTATLTLTGSFAHTNGTNINAGALQFGNGLQNGTISGGITNNSTLIFNNASTQTYTGIISGQGNFIKTGNGLLTLTNSNTFTGSTTINSGILQVNGSLASDIINNSSLILFNSVNRTYRSISGSGNITKDGSATTTLLGTSTFTGVTTISRGILQLGDGTTDGMISGNIINNSQLIVNNSSTQILSGAISGTGILIKNNAGILILTNANTYSGGTTINNGTLQIGDGLTNGNVQFNITNNSTINFNNISDQTASSSISGTGNLIKSGIGTLIFAGGSYTYSGGTIINNGEVRLGNGKTDGSIVGSIINNATLNVNNVSLQTITNSISGSGRLRKTRTGTLILNNSNTYSGQTIVEQGTLDVQTTLLNNGPASVSITATDNSLAGNPILSRRRSTNASYAGFGAISSGGLNSSLEILAGTNLAGTDNSVIMQVRQRTLDEAQTSLFSNVFSLTGMVNNPSVNPDQTDLFVLQMSYDPTLVPNEMMMAATGDLYLATLNETTGQWVNAVSTNIGGTPMFVGDRPWNSSYMTLGQYGVDTNANVVWAVINHNSQFAVVPEPSTWVMGSLTALGFVAVAIRRRRSPC